MLFKTSEPPCHLWDEFLPSYLFHKDQKSPSDLAPALLVQPHLPLLTTWTFTLWWGAPGSCLNGQQARSHPFDLAWPSPTPSYCPFYLSFSSSNLFSFLVSLPCTCHKVLRTFSLSSTFWSSFSLLLLFLQDSTSSEKSFLIPPSWVTFRPWAWAFRFTVFICASQPLFPCLLFSEGLATVSNSAPWSYPIPVPTPASGSEEVFYRHTDWWVT